MSHLNSMVKRSPQSREVKKKGEIRQTKSTAGRMLKDLIGLAKSYIRRDSNSPKVVMVQ